ncbi:MAG: LacI family DNA-binding transcriptional regulator [Clostridia bacterium]|nr:LacI family DNA-binding transcriptional regulator [Clostridia bacterium]
MVTIKMIAQRCGLSTAAVSRALNHLPGVSPENAERVRQTAKEMGYYPNAAARTLKTNRTNLIGVLYRNRLAHEFFSVVLEGIHEEAERSGYELTFLNSEPGMSYHDHARQRQCAGVIVVQGLFDYDSVMTLVQSSIPTVSIEYEYPEGTTIINDNVGAMEDIVHYVHRMGHERIAFIHGEICQVTNERLAGFFRGCRDCGITVPDEYIRPARFRTPYTSADATRELLALPHPPSCILYPDDVSYLGGMAEIEKQGLSIPEDISCFGFDGVSMSRALRPRLTTYYQNAEEMGARAAREVIGAIEDPRCSVPRTVLVSGRIQQGDTVRDLRSEAEKGDDNDDLP